MKAQQRQLAHPEQELTAEGNARLSGEIDRFGDAMIAIRAEIARVAAGEWSPESSPLRGAPHTSRALVGAWDRGYTRELAVFPAGIDPDKYWPPVARIDQAYGDRNLVCACPDPSAFAE